MKYEVRMSANFTWMQRDDNVWKSRSTFIEYVDADGIGEAYTKAKQIRDETGKKIMDANDKLYKLEISLDAVVAKPELVDKPWGRKLTYGDLGRLIITNNKDKIVANLWILPDGTLADDSWICHKGWNNAGKAGSKVVERVCLKCGEKFIPAHKKQRHCTDCL